MKRSLTGRLETSCHLLQMCRDWIFVQGGDSQCLATTWLVLESLGSEGQGRDIRVATPGRSRSRFVVLSQLENKPSSRTIASGQFGTFSNRGHR